MMTKYFKITFSYRIFSKSRPKDRPTDRRINKQMVQEMDRPTEGPTNRWADHRWADQQTDGPTE